MNYPALREIVQAEKENRIENHMWETAQADYIAFKKEYSEILGMIPARNADGSLNLDEAAKIRSKYKELKQLHSLIHTTDSGAFLARNWLSEGKCD